MTKKLLTKLFILLTAVGITMLVSCKKDEKKDDNTPAATCTDGVKNQDETDVDCGGKCAACLVVETSDVEDNNVVESESENMDDFLEEETSSNSNIEGRFSVGCREVDTSYNASTTYSCVNKVRFIRKCNGDSVTSRELRFYFDSTTACKDRRYRKGWIEVTFNGNYKIAGSTITLKTHDYYVRLKNENVWVKVDLTKTIRVISFLVKPLQGERYRKIKVTVDKARIRMNTTDSISWTTSRTKEVKWAGLLAQQIPVRTATHWGTSSGVDRKGNTYSITVDSASAVVRKSDCEWKLISGVMNFTRAGKETRTLDFGSDSTGAQTKVCNQWVKVSVGTNSKVIKMK